MTTYSLSTIELKNLEKIAASISTQLHNDLYTDFQWFIYAEKLARKTIIATITFRTALNKTSGSREFIPCPHQRKFYKSYNELGIGIWLPHD